MSRFVGHLPCDHCGSSDGNALYSDGHTYCFVCYNHESDGEAASGTAVQAEEKTIKKVYSRARINRSHPED